MIAPVTTEGELLAAIGLEVGELAHWSVVDGVPIFCPRLIGLDVSDLGRHRLEERVLAFPPDEVSRATGLEVVVVRLSAKIEFDGLLVASYVVGTEGWV